MSDSAEEFRRSWRIVAAAMIGLGFGYAGLAVYCFGVFVDPLAKAFGWSLTAIGGWTLFANIGYCMVVPFAGRLTDRLGVRRVVMLSIPFFSVTLASMCMLRGNLWALYASGVAVGCVGAGTTAITYGRAVNSWYNVGRGTALGLMTAGLGLASTLTPSLLQGTADRFGWRMGFLLMALIALCPLPLMYFWLNERSGPEKRNAQPTEESGDTRRMALRRPVFWILGTAYNLTCLADGGILVYLVSFLSDAGMSRSRAAFHAGLLGISSMVGRLIGGIVIDRLHVAVVCAFFLAAQAVACLAFAVHELRYATVVVLVIGFALGAESNGVLYSTARYFGMKAFSEIWGILSLSSGVGLGFGSVLFGHLVGESRNYGAAFLVCAFLLFGAAAFFAYMRRYPFLNSPAY